MRKMIALAMIAAVAGTTGCSSTFVQSSTSAIVHPVRTFSALTRPKPVSRILCLWEAAEGQGIDGQPSRGFAGQILFFTHGEESPIQVGGEVQIYEYADFDVNEDDPEPLHRFRFENGAWDRHMTDGTLGISYNVFIPYTRKSKLHDVCALRVVYRSEDGREVSSPFTEVTLASRTSGAPQKAMSRNIVTNSNNRDRLKQVSNQIAENRGRTDKPADDPLNSMTIKLPKQ